MRFRAIAVAAVLASACCAESKPAAPASIGAGEQGVLRIVDGSLTTFYLCPKASYEASVRAAAAKDAQGYDAAVRACPRAPAGALVLVTDLTWDGGREVRVTDGPSKGVSGWLPKEWVQRR